MKTTFQLPPSISVLQGSELVKGEYLAKMENSRWTIGYTIKSSREFAISVEHRDYQKAREILMKKLIMMGQAEYIG